MPMAQPLLMNGIKIASATLQKKNKVSLKKYVHSKLSRGSSKVS